MDALDCFVQFNLLARFVSCSVRWGARQQAISEWPLCGVVTKTNGPIFDPTGADCGPVAESRGSQAPQTNRQLAYQTLPFC